MDPWSIVVMLYFFGAVLAAMAFKDDLDSDGKLAAVMVTWPAIVFGAIVLVIYDRLKERYWKK